MNVQVIIPFRDRGIDPRRGANLDVVMAWWFVHGMEARVIDDGLGGGAQFNRHRAYNRAVARFPETDVFVFTEADMLIRPEQIGQAVRMAAHKPGIVVPFTQYRYLSDTTTEVIRDVYHERGAAEIERWWARPTFDRQSIFGLAPEYMMDNGRSIGAINVMSRQTLDITGGFTEATSGNWYDDNITDEGFAYLTDNSTRFVPGPAVHLYHLPGHKGEHLTESDRAATVHNRRLLREMRAAITRGDRLAVQQLMGARA